MYFLAFMLVYLFGNWDGAIGRHFSGFGLLSLSGVDSQFLPGLIALAVLLLFAIVSYGQEVQLLNIEGKKIAGIVSWVLFFGALSLLLSSTGLLPFMQVLVCPLGLLVGLGFILLPKGRAEFLHLILFVAAVGPLLWTRFGG